MRAIGYEKISTLSSATGLNIPEGATMAWLQAETANIRYRLDGASPNALTGFLMRSTEPPIELQSELQYARFIQETAGAKLSVIYFG